MASPERDIPCCAGTGPRSVRKIPGFQVMSVCHAEARRASANYQNPQNADHKTRDNEYIRLGFGEKQHHHPANEH